MQEADDMQIDAVGWDDEDEDNFEEDDDEPQREEESGDTKNSGILQNRRRTPTALGVWGGVALTPTTTA